MHARVHTHTYAFMPANTHTLLECPITTELFQKNGYDFNACNNVRDILYNTNDINSIVQLIVHCPVGKLVQYNIFF